MWVVIIGANEAILRRVPKNLKIIDIRQAKEQIVFRDDYIQVFLPQLNEKSIKNSFSTYLNGIDIKKFISFTESYLLLAAQLNEQYAIKSNSVSCVQTLCNKNLMRERLSDDFKVWSKLVDVSDLKTVLEAIDFDVIIKPVDGFGSRLISLYRPMENNIDCIIEKYHSLDCVLVEEYIFGDEYSVEAISCEGVHQIIAITKKFTGEDFIEIGHIMPPILTDEIQNKIKEKVRLFLDLMGLYEGPSHTEIILNKYGVHIIEGHSRTGGDRIVSLVRLTTGIDLIECYFHQLVALDYCPLPIKSKFAQVVFINFPEKFVYLGLPDLIPYYANIDEIEVNVAVGDEVIRPEHSAMRHAMVVLYDDDYNQCMQIANDIKARFVERL